MNHGSFIVVGLKNGLDLFPVADQGIIKVLVLKKQILIDSLFRYQRFIWSGKDKSEQEVDHITNGTRIGQ